MLALEEEPHETIPLYEIDGRRRVPRLDADHPGLHFGGRPEIVAADSHELVYLCKQLCIDRQPAVQLVPRLGRQPQSELLLEHEHGTPEQRPMSKKLEHNSTRNVVWNVSNAHVKKW